MQVHWMQAHRKMHIERPTWKSILLLYYTLKCEGNVWIIDTVSWTWLLYPIGQWTTNNLSWGIVKLGFERVLIDFFLSDEIS